MLSWKRTLSIGLILIMLASAVVLFTPAEAGPTRASTPTLTSPSVIPYNGGYNDTLFNFTVFYTDFDGDVPLYVSIIIDSVAYNMTENRGINWSYTTGVVFFYTTYLTAGTHHYYFVTQNVLRESTSNPSNTSNAFALSVQSRSPQTNYLSNATYFPTRPDDTTGVNFTVDYSHPNGTVPYHIYLVIRQGGLNQTHNMTVIGNNYTSGVTYYKFLQLGHGYYEYQFTGRIPLQGLALPTNSMIPFTVARSGNQNDPPTLDYQGFSPTNPTPGQNTTFWVEYRDNEGDAARDVNLYYYSQTDQHNDTVVNMTVGSGNVSNGVNCSVTITAPLENGTYYFYFKAWDIHGALVTTGDSRFDVGNETQPPPRYPYLTNGHHSPLNPTTNDTITFSVKYIDPNGYLTPHLVRMGISGTNEVLSLFNMSAGYGNINTGLFYTVNMSLAADNYTYSFAAYVGNYTIGFPLQGTLSITVTNGSVTPPIDRSPVLSSGSHYPASPVSGSNITFSITYSDGDNDAPRFIKLHINEITSSRPYSVYNMTWSGMKFFQSVTATYILTLTAGNYSYYFTTSSTSFNISYPRNGSLNTITVMNNVTPPPPSQNRAPTLTSGMIIPTSPIVNQTIVFYTTYTDADNDPATYVKLHLLGGSGSNYVNFSLNVPRGIYKNSVVCTYSTSLPAGTYYYYFTAASTNYTVTYPSSGTLSFTVSTSTQPPPSNKSNIGAHTKIVYDPDGATIDITDSEEDVSVSMIDSGEDFFEIEVSSDSGEDRVIVIDLDPNMFDVDSPDDIVVKVDGEKIEYEYVADPAKWNGVDPAYYLEYTEAGAVLYVLLPEADTHTITAKVPDVQGDQVDTYWYYVIAVVIVLVIAAAVAISLLTMAQKKRIQEYYEDFDTGVRDNKIASGRIIDEDDLEWDDLIEVEE